MRVHLVMILNQLLDGQQGKSVGGLFEKVSNSLLLTDMPTICTEHYYVCLLLHNLYFHFICFILISFHLQVAL